MSVPVVRDGGSERARVPGSQAVGHPVDVASGVFFSTVTELLLEGPLPLRFERHYSTALLGQRRLVAPFGPGWASSLDQRVHPTIDGFFIHVDPLGNETL